jgi:hypothetical protein
MDADIFIFMIIMANLLGKCLFLETLDTKVLGIQNIFGQYINCGLHLTTFKHYPRASFPWATGFIF